MNKPQLTLFAILALLGVSCSKAPAPTGAPHHIDIETRADLHAWFRYAPDRPVVVSGHRGGMVAGYPENCIESFGKTLTMMPSFFEIDPRLTRDSVIVLMHDATIDRTTDGSGRVSDYTWEELRRFRLKDRDGKVTEFRIPTLEEAIQWSRGKTILNLDIKDVPLEFMSDFINRLNPPHVMYTVHNARQARLLLDRDPDAMFSTWCKAAALRLAPPAGDHVHDLRGSDPRPPGDRDHETTGLRAGTPLRMRCHRDRLPLPVPGPGPEPPITPSHPSSIRR